MGAAVAASSCNGRLVREAVMVGDMAFANVNYRRRLYQRTTYDD